MRPFILAGLLTAAGGLPAVPAQAAIVPTIEFEAGPLASVPITSGTLSAGGVTVTGAPVIGNLAQAILDVGGTPSLGVFNPLQIEVTEFNLASPNGASTFAASISGTLTPSSNVSWTAYVDPGNTPFGTADLVASNSFADPSSVVPLGFTDAVSRAGNLDGPFALTEILTVSAPAGVQASFNSSVSVTRVAVAEPRSLFVIGVGVAALAAVVARRRPMRATAGA